MKPILLLVVMLAASFAIMANSCDSTPPATTEPPTETTPPPSETPPAEPTPQQQHMPY